MARSITRAADRVAVWHEAMPMVYHHTSPEAAEAIRKERKFAPRGDHPMGVNADERSQYTYFMNVPESEWASGFGPARVDVDVPEEDFQRDFEVDPFDSRMISRSVDSNGQPFQGQVPYRARPDKIKPEWIKRAVWREHPWSDSTPFDHSMDPKGNVQSWLRGPQDAYDEGHGQQRSQDHPPDPTPTDVPWFHATYTDLPCGTLLAPHKGKVPWLDRPYHGGLDNRANWTWIEYDLTHSDEWLGYMVRDHGEGHLYRVKPRLGPFPWNGSAKEGWVTDVAVILEKVRSAGAPKQASRWYVAMPTYYHNTENPDFAPDSNHIPQKMYLNAPKGSGIYLTDNTSDWTSFNSGYQRRHPRYRAEFNSDTPLEDNPNVTRSGGGVTQTQYWVPGDQMSKLDFRGTSPIDRTGGAL